jgi:hypothetical protein
MLLTGSGAGPELASRGNKLVVETDRESPLDLE